MIAHTLIPERDTYALAILILYGMSAHAVASFAYTSYFAQRHINFWLVYNGVMLCVLGWGSLLFDLRQLFGDSALMLVVSVPVGLATGIISTSLDRKITRQLLQRRAAGARPLRSTRQIPRPLVVRSVGAPGSSGTAKKKMSARQQDRQRVLREVDAQPPGLRSTSGVAILEELLYRGLLVRACFLLPSIILAAPALLATSLIFALSHIRYGWPHALAKLPLSLLCLLVVLATGSVLGAIVAHLYFNIRVWNDQQHQPVIVRGMG